MKETVIETSTNFCVSNLELGSIPPLFIHQLGRSRWLIDSEVFQTITTEGRLKRPSVHQDRGQALIALTMIRVLAFTLTQVFFHRSKTGRPVSGYGWNELQLRPPLSYRKLLAPRVGAWLLFFFRHFKGLWASFATSFSRANPGSPP